MTPMPRNLLPVGCDSSLLRAIADALDLRVLPAVDDPAALEAALKAYPVVVAVIGTAWPKSAMTVAMELLGDQAAACVEFLDTNVSGLEERVARGLAERSLRIETAFAGRILELLPDQAFVKDRNGRFLACNQALARHFGVEDPSLLLGCSDFDFFSAEHAQQAFNDEQEVMRTGQEVRAKLEKETYDQDRPTWCLTWRAPLHDPSGRVIGTCGFSRDVTELKSTEAALSTERHLLEALLTGMPDSVFIKDRQGRFLLANHVVAKWMGTTPELLRGKRDEDFFPAEIAAAYRADEESVMATGMPVVNREEHVRTADGRDLWVLTTKLPYCNDDGAIVGIIGMSRNVSLRKAFDEQLKAAQTEIAELRAEVARLRSDTQPLDLHESGRSVPIHA